jgi:tRNA-(ms[2]io[6]A)-hydroxylase
LKSATSSRWLEQVDRQLPSILIDHAHCEKKAAATAMSLITAYGSARPQLCGPLSEIVVEELEHFGLVLKLLDERGISFGALKPAGYGRRLNELVCKSEPQRAIDRMLIASLIEARSCERFSLLRDHVADRALATFYGRLFESEARHHSTYLRLATCFGREADVRARLEELGLAEARIIEAGDQLPRMHS